MNCFVRRLFSKTAKYSCRSCYWPDTGLQFLKQKETLIWMCLLQWKYLTSLPSLEIEFYRIQKKKINKYCHVLLWALKLKWLYLLLHESDRKIFWDVSRFFLCRRIFLEFILVTQLGAACKPHVQSYIWKSKQQMLARKSLHNENFIPNIQILHTYSLSFALHFNSWVSFATLFTKAAKQILKIRNRKWNNNGNNNLKTLRKRRIKTVHKKFNGKTDK